MRISPMAAAGGRDRARKRAPNRFAFKVSHPISRRLLPAFVALMLVPVAKPVWAEVPLTKFPSEAQAELCAKDTRIKIEGKVKKIAIEHLGVDESKVTENASFIDDLGADNLDTVELTMAFEEEFDIEIPDEVAKMIVTVKGAADFAEGQRCGPRP